MRKFLFFVLSVILSPAVYSQVDLDSLPVHPFEKFEEISNANPERASKRPLIFHFKHRNGGELYYIGAGHFYDPSHPMVERIDSIWKWFKPDVAFWEGGVPGRFGKLPETLEETIREKGEPGLVRFLARKYGVPDSTLEPAPFMDRQKYSDEQIILSVVLTQAEQFRRKKKELTDELLEKLLGQLRNFGISNGPSTRDEFAITVKKYFPGLRDWRDIDLDFVGPKCKGTPGSNFINHMGCEANTRRDRHMVKKLLTEVQAGKKVFAVVGASHLLSQEPAFIKYFGHEGEVK